MATFKVSNAPNVNNMEAFLAAVNKYGAGLAMASRFLVIIKPVPAMFDNNVSMKAMPNELVYLCEQAELPGKALTVHDARYYGPSFKYPVQTVYSDITLNFMVRDKMLEKEFFDNWMMSINPSHTYDFMYKTTYATDITILQYSMLQGENDTADSNKNATYSITLKKAFPINVAPMQLIWGEEGYHRVGVTFSYNEWVRPNEPLRVGYDLVNVIGTSGTVEIVSGSVLGGSIQYPTSTTVTSVPKGDRK